MAFALGMGLSILAFLALLAGAGPQVLAGRVVAWSVPWMPSAGVNLSLYIDGLAWFFGLLVSGIGALVFTYASAYMHGAERVNRFFWYLLLFMVSMLGLVLSGNLILLFVFWELTTVSSYLLIGFNYERPEARAGAQRSLVVTVVGGLGLLAAFVLVLLATGSLEVADLLADPAALRGHPSYGAILALLAFGAFTKSAQFPFHVWLPGAMEAPTPVSAYLHSATMVKAGVFLLARFLPLLGGTLPWLLVVGLTGVATMLAGAYLALSQRNLKAFLAYTTIGQLGVLTGLLGLGTLPAVVAAMAQTLNHALYKGALFMIAGNVEHGTGTRDLGRLGGLARRGMPRTAATALVVALSMAGLPPLLGFVSKELILEAAFGPGAHGWASAVFVLGLGLNGALNLAAAVVLAWDLFFRRSRVTPPHQPHEPGRAMAAPPAVLAAGVLGFGLAPALAERVLQPAVAAVAARPAGFHLELWHGFTAELAVGLLVIASGLVAYRYLALLVAPARVWPPALQPIGWYEALVGAVERGTRRLNDLVQHRPLRHHLTVVLLAAAGFLWVTLFLHWRVLPWGQWSPVGPEFVVVAAVVVAGALATTLLRTGLGAILSLGVVGYMVSLMYVILQAPDLALTQLLIETLTVVLFVAVFAFLPRAALRWAGSGYGSRGADLAAAGLVGAGAAALALLAVTEPVFPRISDYFVANSLELAGGKNVVNVILVDFRGLDTMGEITVLAIAAAGVFALLRLGKRGSQG